MDFQDQCGYAVLYLVQYWIIRKNGPLIGEADNISDDERERDATRSSHGLIRERKNEGVRAWCYMDVRNSVNSMPGAFARVTFLDLISP